MKRNMKQWVTDYINAPAKKGMPILSFPGIQLIGHTVEELVRSGELQAQCMKAIADRLDRKSTRLNSSHITRSRMPSSA